MLEEARRLGFLGPGPVEAHMDHADGFGAVIRGWDTAPGTLRSAVDLGSGGGVPGLVLALDFVAVQWFLIDATKRRVAFLRTAVTELGLASRVTVIGARAEEFGRRAEHRGQHQVVVARGFGPAAVAAECAAPLLQVGGRAVVSEPPGGAGWRWPAAGLHMVGMATAAAVTVEGASYQMLAQEHRCPERYPRRTGVPSKRPLF